MSITTSQAQQELSNKESSQIIVSALLMCTLGAVFYCYEYYLRVAPSVLQPELMNAYGLSQAGLGTLIAYYYLAYVPLQIPVGLMMDYWGPRKVLTAACLSCALGTYLFATTHILAVAKLGRFLVGFGSAFAYVGVLKITNIWLPARYFSLVAGLCSALGMLGAMSGGLLMSSFIKMTGWQNALMISSYVGLILAAVLFLIIRDNSDQEFITKGRASHQGLSLWSELIEVITNKQLWINGAIGCLTFLPLTAFAEFWAVSYLEKLNISKEYSALGAGIIFFGYALGGPIWGWVSELAKSRRMPMMFGSIAAAICGIIMLSCSGSNLIYLFGIMFVLGLFASAQILIFAVGSDSCRPGMSATTVSFTNFIVMLGGILLQPLVGKILDKMQIITSEGLIINSIDSYRIALLIIPLGLILAGTLCFFLKETYKTSTSS